MAGCSRRLLAAGLGLLLCVALGGGDASAQRGGGAAAAPEPVTPPAPSIALTGARIVDGTGAAPSDNMTIVIVKGRIQAVGPDGMVRIPPDATRVDMSGKTVMPGLINTHGHLDAGDEKQPLYDRINQQLRTYAQYGVTTVVTLGDDGKESVKVRDENDKGDPVRAHLYVSGPAVVAKTADEAKKAIDAAADAKVNIIKTRMEGNKDDMTPDVFAALIEQAHNRGLRVAAHLYYLKDAKALVNAGLDIIAHSIRDLDADAAFIEELKKRNVGYIPTLTRDLSVFVYETTPAFFTDPFFLKGEAAYKAQLDQLKLPATQRRTRDNPQTDQIKKALVVANRNLKRLSDAGVPIALG